MLPAILVGLVLATVANERQHVLGPLDATVRVESDALVVLAVAEGVSGLNVGDRIVGIGTTPFDPDYAPSVEGLVSAGPLVEFGDALRHAWGLTGRLELLLATDTGRRSAEVAVGFAPTFGDSFPEQSAWADAAAVRLADWLIQEQRADGLWSGDASPLSGLALLATGRAVDRAAALRAAREIGKTNRSDAATILIAEASLATHNSALLRGITPRPAHRIAELPSDMLGLALLARGVLRDVGVEGAEHGLWSLRSHLDERTRDDGYLSGSLPHDLGPTALAMLGVAATSSPDSLVADHGYLNRGATYLAEHAHALMHGAMFSAAFLSTARTDPAALRRLADTHRWWFSLAIAPDGGAHAQPHPAGLPTTDAPRVRATAELLLALMAPRQKLRILGQPLPELGRQPATER
ncbi:MAG: hypothetical protein WD226_13315 [Planctomycetota bacterium]